MALTYLNELWGVLLELSLPLLAGLLLAGALRTLLPTGLVRAHLSQATLGSTIRAALVGVPMPLCSCGVVPTAIGLRNQGASKGATTSFLISTPQTGVDSVLVSASFLGWPFAIFKLAAAFVTGVLGGSLVNRYGGAEADADPSTEQGESWQADGSRLVGTVRYALFDLLASIDLWLIGGILIAAAVTTAIPENYLHQVAWAQGPLGMLLVLAVALPLYVCTTASVPIAASMIAAGMPAGSALVFLMAGPATNVATIGAVYRGLGMRILAIYLGTVIVASVGLGITFDFVLRATGDAVPHHDHVSAHWWDIGAALLLLLLLCYLSARRLWGRFLAGRAGGKEQAMDLTLRIGGMTCQHCVNSVRQALEDVDRVEQAVVDLNTGVVKVKGEDVDRRALASAVSRAGYKVLETDLLSSK